MSKLKEEIQAGTAKAVSGFLVELPDVSKHVGHFVDDVSIFKYRCMF